MKKRICKKSNDRNKPDWCEPPSAADDGQEECKGGLFQLDIQKDDSSDVLSYRVKRKNGQGKFKQKVLHGNVKGPKTYFSKSLCATSMGECFKLIVVDRGNKKDHGLCCEKGTGFYRIQKNGECGLHFLLTCTRRVTCEPTKCQRIIIVLITIDASKSCHVPLRLLPPAPGVQVIGSRMQNKKKKVEFFGSCS